MKQDDFDHLAQVLKQKSGLVLTQDKGYLVESRLMPLCRKYNTNTLDEFLTMFRCRPQPDMVRDVTEAMTTNETLFFRDTKPFERFRDLVLPNLIKNRRTVRIWCAACSSGQEPYSLAMILKEQEVKLGGVKFEIVATDIANEVLAKARQGLYTQFEVQRGLPIQMLVKYFKQQGDKWQINDVIRQMVQFQYFNLLDDMKSLRQFDVIFCRNVLIYFDAQTKGNVLDQMAGIMAADGYLFLGGAETIIGLTNKLEQVTDERGMFRVKGNSQVNVKSTLAI